MSVSTIFFKKESGEGQVNYANRELYPHELKRSQNTYVDCGTFDNEV